MYLLKIKIHAESLVKSVGGLVVIVDEILSMKCLSQRYITQILYQKKFRK